MPKVSTKENKNVFFQKREELGLTRDKASRLLITMSPERIEKIENERCEPHPDEVLLMAEKYKAPELCNYFCSNVCSIGQKYVPEVKVAGLSQIVLKLLSSLNTISKCRDRLIDITYDGKIDENEIGDFISIREDLEEISVTVESLQLWSEQMIASGAIDVDKYNKLLEQRKK